MSGRTVIVTGGAGGLGGAICEEFASLGDAVAVWDRDGEGAAAVAGRVGGRAYALDVAESAAVDEAVAAVGRELGPVEVLVNCAGVSNVGDHTHELSDEIWHESIAVMQTSVFFCSRAAGRVMLERGSGSIVNIASIRGFSPNPGRLAYCASKAAVLMMTKVMAGEWARRGVRVNAIAPGVQRTPMWDRDVARGVLSSEHYESLVPAGRIGDPREVARLCAFLASDAAAYITGACVTIDGGLTSIPAG